jgi:hypothetical protein
MARTQSRESMALECLTVLLDLADHKDTCLACRNNVKDFCSYEMKYGEVYRKLIGKIYSGKNARKPANVQR